MRRYFVPTWLAAKITMAAKDNLEEYAARQCPVAFMYHVMLWLLIVPTYCDIILLF